MVRGGEGYTRCKERKYKARITLAQLFAGGGIDIARQRGGLCDETLVVLQGPRLAGVSNQR